MIGVNQVLTILSFLLGIGALIILIYTELKYKTFPIWRD